MYSLLTTRRTEKKVYLMKTKVFNPLFLVYVWWVYSLNILSCFSKENDLVYYQ